MEFERERGMEVGDRDGELLRAWAWELRASGDEVGLLDKFSDLSLSH